MNAIEIIDTLSPAAVFGIPGGIEGILSKIETEVRGTIIDTSTPAGREAAKSLAYKVARSKTALDDMGKNLVADIKAKAGAIDAERRTIRDRLDALKDEVRKPVTDWEAAEERRVRDHEQAIVAMIEAATLIPSASPSFIRERINTVATLCTRQWEEFHERADQAATDALHRLNDALELAEQRERDAAELAELRRLKAERDARDQAEAEAKAKAERAKQEAEERAEIERRRAEQIERDKKEIAERAAAKAVEDERRRVAGEEARKAAEQAEKERQERRRQENAKHREKVNTKIANAMLEVIEREASPEDAVRAIINAIAAGDIPHVSINY